MSAPKSNTCNMGEIKLYSPSYFALCSVGGILSCGITHTSVVPIDLVKCRKQVGIKTSISSILAKDGIRGLTLGWAPTFVGYSLQGAGKFGLYEFFKYGFSDILGPDFSSKNKDLIWLSASACAEIFADMFLCPFEAVKVRIQTTNPDIVPRNFPTTLSEGVPKILNSEGIAGLYKGLVPLWCRQVPYTMMKFWAFERTVKAIYDNFVPKPRDQCSGIEQLGVTAISGYIAGIFCAIVSHPADSVVSRLNQYETRPSFMHVLRELGPVGIWRGLGLRIFMIGTLTCLQWFIYDSFKVAVGFPGSGGH